MSLAELGEFGLIDQLRTQVQQRAGVQVGIGDDAAVLRPLSSPVVTSDALVEGVHFRRDWTSPRALGRKALAVNVSDIAAMGGVPVAAFINLTVSRADDAAWLQELYEGFEDQAREHNFTIAGGDMSRADRDGGTVLGITVIGNARRPILRSGARADDVLIISGQLGCSAAGLWLLQHSGIDLPPQVSTYLLMRHHEPAARVLAMQAAVRLQNTVHAALDISDGLAGDAAHMAKASGVAMEIDVAALPCGQQLVAAAAAAEAAGAAPGQAQRWALYGGEDYELLLAVAPEAAQDVCDAMLAMGAQPAVIGKCSSEAAGGVWLCDGTKKMRPTHKAWTHF